MHFSAFVFSTAILLGSAIAAPYGGSDVDDLTNRCWELKTKSQFFQELDSLVQPGARDIQVKRLIYVYCLNEFLANAQAGHTRAWGVDMGILMESQRNIFALYLGEDQARRRLLRDLEKVHNDRVTTLSKECVKAHLEGCLQGKQQIDRVLYILILGSSVETASQYSGGPAPEESRMLALIRRSAWSELYDATSSWLNQVKYGEGTNGPVKTVRKMRKEAGRALGLPPSQWR